MELPPLKLFFITVVLSFSGSFHFGYQLTIVNPTESVFREFLNSTFENHYGRFISDIDYRFLWSSVINLQIIGCLIGSFISWPITEKIGRKPSFYISLVISSLGCVLSGASYFAYSWELFSVGRLLSGTAAGFSFCIQPLYYSEISPDKYRGFLNAMTGTLYEFGFTFGSIIALPQVLGTTNNWHILFWLELVPNIIAVALLPFLPESPKFLLASNKNKELARKSFVYFKHVDVDDSLAKIEEEIAIEKNSLKILDIFRKPYLRKGVLIASLTNIAESFSGIVAIAYFSTHLLIRVGVSPIVAPVATVGITVQCFIAAVTCSLIVDKHGRRPLILIGVFTCIAMDIVFVIFSAINHYTGAQWAGYICIISSVVFCFFFSLGPGVIQWFIGSELVPQNARSACTTVAMVSQWVSFWLAAVIFFPLESVANEWSFFLFIIPTTLITVYFYFHFPETRNKSSLEVIESLGYKTPEGPSINLCTLKE